MPTPITKAILPDIIERLRNGAALIGESKALGYSHNGPLRTALREHLGKDGYDNLMSAKRPVALTRTRDESGELAPLIDDSGVPVITSTPTAEGWKIRYAGLHPDPIFIAPDAKRYEAAPDNAKADLIVDMTERGLGRKRLRLVRGERATMRLGGGVAEVKVEESKPAESEKARRKRESKRGAEWAKENPEEAARLDAVEKATRPTPKKEAKKVRRKGGK